MSWSRVLAFVPASTPRRIRAQLSRLLSDLQILAVEWPIALEVIARVARRLVVRLQGKP